MNARPALRRRRCAENDALILEILREANSPLSAYDIAYRATSKGCRVVPNQVYRTLNRLIDQHAVVRIETLNAYIPRQSQANVCLICDNCRMIEFVDMPGLRRTIIDAAPGCRFKVLHGVIEAQGRCTDCQSARPDAN